MDAHIYRPSVLVACCIALAVSTALPALAAPGEVLFHQKISSTEGGFKGVLDANDNFGVAVELGDLDGDGVVDLAVSASADDDGGNNRGAIWILFLNADGTVKSHQKISDTEGGFTGALTNDDSLGFDLAHLGDVDGDGVVDLVASATFDSDGGSGRGAVWVLFLNIDGTVKDQQKISSTEGGFTGQLDNDEYFGWTVTGLGDLDLDGVADMAVCAPFDNDGGFERGSFWVLFLNADGTVKAHQKVSSTEGGFTGVIDDFDTFGLATAVGDLDGDGVVDLAVGAPEDDDGGVPPNADRGAIWVLFMNTDGTVKSHQKISDTEGGFTGELDDEDLFGEYVSGIGDLDLDGVPDVAVGSILDDDGGTDHGAVWILFLNTDGTVKAHQKISSTEGNFTGELDTFDFFCFVNPAGDINGDGATDLAVGAILDDDGAPNAGACWVLFMDDGGATPVELASFELTPSAGAVTISWSTSFESNHLGFHVLRADDSSDETTRVTDELIRGANTASDYRFVDRLVNAGSTYRYQLEALDRSGGTQLHDLGDVTIAPAGQVPFVLHAARPNPFNPATTISFEMSERGQARLTIHNAMGRRVRTLVDAVLDSGHHELAWNGLDDSGRRLASGVYLYELEAGNRSLTRRVTLAK